MTYTAKLTRKSQITVPTEVRERLDLKQGDRAVWILRGNEAILVSPKRYAEMTSGILSGTYGRSKDEVRRYLDEERQGWT